MPQVPPESLLFDARAANREALLARATEIAETYFGTHSFALSLVDGNVFVVDESQGLFGARFEARLVS